MFEFELELNIMGITTLQFWAQINSFYVICAIMISKLIILHSNWNGNLLMISELASGGGGVGVGGGCWVSLIRNCSQVNATEHLWWYVNIGAGNGLASQGNKPVLESMLTLIDVTILTLIDVTRPRWVKQKYQVLIKCCSNQSFLSPIGRWEVWLWF